MSCARQAGPRKGQASHWPGDSNKFVGRSHSNCTAKVSSYRAFHKRNGYCDLAYNLVVCVHGHIINGRGADRRSGANGSSAANTQYGSVLWLIGPGETPTAEQRAAYLRAHAMLGGGSHKTHMDVRPQPTACPGPAVTAYIRQLQTGVPPVPPPGTEPLPPTTPGEEDEDMTLIEAPASSGGYAWWMLQGNHLCSLTAGTAANARAGGIKAFRTDRASWDNIVRTYPVVR